MFSEFPHLGTPSRRASVFKKHQRARGFALLITITLLAFLVLLLVSLASLTRVETSVADNTRHMAAARQAALTALNVALGDLQKYAGADQRATARADILGSSDQNGARRWTGVWGNSAATGSLSSAPVRLQWLVSGNESTVFDPLAVPASAPATTYAPDSDITGVSVDMSVDTAVTVGGDKGVLLVGPKTAGEASGAEENYVVAPLVDIDVSGNSVPGAGSGGSNLTMGRYAFWIGDEGIKARMNVVDPYVTPTPEMSEAADADSLFRLMSPQRAALERLDGFASFPVNAAGARGLLSLAQAGFLDAGLTTPLQLARFHDLSGASRGVLSDSLAGGLKRDLSYAFSRNLADYRTVMGLAGSGEHPISSSIVQGPTWEQLRSYGNLDGSAALPLQPQTATQHGVYPILTQVRLAFGGTTVAASDGQQQLVLHIYPSFVLANPYTAPIAPGRYHVRLDFDSGSTYLSSYVGRETTPFWRKSMREMFEGQTFLLDCTEPLAAGEARIFTLDSSPADETWSAVKTYRFINDWDAGAAKITLNTATEGGSAFPETVLYGSGNLPNGQGVHMIWGDAPGGNPPWAGDGGTYTGYRVSGTSSRSGAGGTLSVSLTDEVGNIFQRVETMGYSDWPISQYGLRGTGNGTPARPFVAPGPDNRLGAFIFRMADSGAFTATSVHPYYSQFNWRAPLVSRTALFSTGSVNSLILFNQTYHFGSAAMSQWIRPHTDPDRMLTHVEWNGAVGRDTSQPQARLDWRAFDVPRADSGLVSLAQLQHFNAGGHNDGLTMPVAANPLASRPTSTQRWRPRFVANPYAIGNSRAHPNVERDKAVNTSNSNQHYYDLSYLLNRELFDGHFFSTYPQTGEFDLATGRLPNPRMRPFRQNLLSSDADSYRGGESFGADSAYQAARNLMLDGAFNVNSTSVEAWRVLLSSFAQTRFNGDTGLTGAFVRSVHQSAGSVNADNGIGANAWNGFRNLTNDQIDALAKAIVDEIRRRGVSVGMADFVNRRLVTGDTGLSGVIQAAIDAADESASPTARINKNFATSVNTSTGASVSALLPVPTTSQAYSYPAHMVKHGLEGIAGWLSQADVLQATGSLLAARSDTFRVRAYGEKVNPITNTVEGRAWCEAIVQRMPDYVESGDDAVIRPAALTQAANRAFGRRFEVVGFRWLTPSDI